MASTRLTPFAKLLITILIVGVLVFAGKWVLENTDFGRSLMGNDGDRDTAIVDDYDDRDSNRGETRDRDRGNTTGGDDVITVGVVDWGGYAGGQYWNKGFRANTDSRFYKDYGFQVEFKVLNDFVASREAWKSGEVDLLWATIDAFPTEVNDLGKNYEPVVVFQSDWSRGGDAIVARRGINKVADLRGKKIAVAELTPSHSFLLWLLDAGGLSSSDVQLVPQSNAIDAAKVFQSGQVDAAVVWSPDDELSVQAVPGARILESTRSASNIIADVFFAKREYVERNRTRLEQLYEGWMKGAAAINNSDQAKREAAKILTQGWEATVSEADALAAINNVRLTTHGDNLNFFGLNRDYKGVTGQSLYNSMSRKYGELGYIEGDTPDWRRISYPGLVRNANLSGAQNAAEATRAFTPVTDAEGDRKEAIATKQVSINFRTGEYQLDPNAKNIIDREFVEIAKAFANSRIRIEGNTDSTGSRATNVALSKKRAAAVRDYLVEVHNMPRDRFIVIGNGPDNPVASNNTEGGRAQNRRTDFELVRD